MSSQISI